MLHIQTSPHFTSCIIRAGAKCTVYALRAQNLRQGIVMTTNFETQVSRMGLSSFVDINIFVVKYYFIFFLYNLHFLKSLKSKYAQMLRPQKGNSRVSFNDTLINFGLSCTAQCRVDPTRFLQQMYSGKITYIPVVYIDSYTFSIFSYMQYM